MRHCVHFKYDSSNAEDVDPVYTNYLVDVPCNIFEKGGLEKYRGRQLQAETTHIIETRFYSGLKPNMIAVNAVDETEYLIKRITDTTGRDRWLVIEATEVVA